MRTPQSGFAFICSAVSVVVRGASIVAALKLGRRWCGFAALVGVDIDAAAARHLYRLAGVLAMASNSSAREQYRDFRGVDPAGGCDPRELVLFKKVPRIATRGRAMPDRKGTPAVVRIRGRGNNSRLWKTGRTGAIPQAVSPRHPSHAEGSAVFVRAAEAAAPRCRGVLGKMPLPGNPCAAQCTRFRNRYGKLGCLAFVEAGPDWRSLNKLRVVDGLLADYLIVPELRNGMLGCDRFGCVGVHGDVPDNDSCFGRC